MFIALDAAPMGLQPASSEISNNDWRVLARYWYPVAVAGDVKDQPVAGRLLDVDLVIYRTEGKVSVALDVCPHRHIRLSAGRIANDRLVCRFHGMEFNAAGQCTAIPSIGRQVTPPNNYRLHTVRHETRHGLVWVCLDGDSTESIPDFPRATFKPEHIGFGPVRDWPVSAARQVENFTDLAHIPFVHPTTLGGDANAAIERAQVEHQDQSLVITADFGPHVDIFDPVLTYVYTVTLPFNIEFFTRRISNQEEQFLMWNIPVPISAHRCRVFEMHLADEPVVSKESGSSQFDPVNDEDIAVLSCLARPDLPLNDNHEVHFPVDNVSREYRKRLRGLGLGK